MKTIINVFFMIFTAVILSAANIPDSVAVRSGTYTQTYKERQKRVITQAKCMVKRQNEPDTNYKEQSVSGSFQNQSEASQALTTKISEIYGQATVLNQTSVEYVYGGWEPNGQDAAVVEGKRSPDDYEDWVKNNPTAIVKKVEPGVPCDAPDPGEPDHMTEWAVAEDKVAQSRSVTKYYKYYYTITYTSQSQ